MISNEVLEIRSNDLIMESLHEIAMDLPPIERSQYEILLLRLLLLILKHSIESFLSLLNRLKISRKLILISVVNLVVILLSIPTMMC